MFPHCNGLISGDLPRLKMYASFRKKKKKKKKKSRARVRETLHPEAKPRACAHLGFDNTETLAGHFDAGWAQRFARDCLMVNKKAYMLTQK